MQHTKLLLSFALLSVFFAPALVLAHEQRSVQIGGTVYQFTVGSLGEPVIVDDKTGVDLGVKLLDEAGLASMGANVDHSQMVHLPDGTMLTAGAAVEGLEQTLQVELQADGKKKVLPFTTVYGTPGKYKAVFIPTTEAAFSYRIFGTVAGTPVDLLFSCNPGGHAMSGDVMLVNEKLSDQVTVIARKGGFGCFAAKEDFGFPEEAPTLISLERGGNGSLLWVGVFAIAASLFILLRRRSS